nr:immunoglobulin light chain junction region [Macaca mulatta]MOW59675.1 immunoglobulin light chain junction region [Macaca mulatta]
DYSCQSYDSSLSGHVF